MKKRTILVRLLSVFTICSCLISFSALAGEINSGAAAKHEPITEQLITMIEHNAELRSMLVESIDKTTKINPDKVTNPVRTLEEYYNFIDWAAKALPWSILPNAPWSSLYDQIDQSLDYFYFVNDQPLSQL